MSSEFLSICIPTYNRSHFLRDLLASIASEITVGKLTPDVVKVYVSDNASTDDTREVVHEILGDYPHLVYAPNSTNVGGDRNILACYQKSHGCYRWIIGDDEVLPPNSLPHILHILRTKEPAWFINNVGDLEQNKAFRLPKSYQSARAFLVAALRCYPFALMHAGFISGNVFRADCFDIDLGLQMVSHTTFSQLFALLHGLKMKGGTVYFTDVVTLTLRPTRPVPADRRLPPNSDGNWEKCMAWIKTEFDIPELDIHLQSKLVSRATFRDLARHPFRTIAYYHRFLIIPGTYIRILRRLYWLTRA